MTDQQQQQQIDAIVAALNNIHLELKNINLKLGRPGFPAPAVSAPSEPAGEYGPKRPFRPGSRPPARGPKTGGPARSPRSASSAGGPPRKKGDGYPKKPR